MRAKTFAVYAYAKGIAVGSVVCVHALGADIHDHSLVEVTVDEVTKDPVLGLIGRAHDPHGQTYDLRHREGIWTCTGGSGMTARGVAMRIIKTLLAPDLPLDDFDKRREYLNARPQLERHIETVEKLVSDAEKRRRP